MSTVFCKKFKGEKEALESPPLFGPIGKIIFENISKEAFEEWMELEIKIINEERLDLSEKKSQDRLFEAMINFLELEEFFSAA